MHLIFSASRRAASFRTKRDHGDRNGAFDLTSTTLQPLNRLRKLWREGHPTFGAIATIPSIQTVQIMARSGFDWIVVDLEHGPIDLGSAHAMITATAGTSCIPLARDRRQRALACEGADGYRRARHQFSDDLQPRGRRKGRTQRALSTARRAALGPVSRAVSLGRLDARLHGDCGRWT
jgi:hypothetical protein